MRFARARDGSALEFALECMAKNAPEQTRRARRALDLLLKNVRISSWPEVAWQFSGLTPDGFPLELTFSSQPGHAIRYATEIGGPEMPEQERLGEAFRLYHMLASHTVSAQTEQAMRAVQAGRELAYGAWFGGAHTSASDRYKIYAEVPKGACVDKFLPGIVNGDLPLQHCHSRPVMLGYQPDSEIREVYFRAASLEQADIGNLLWSHNFNHQYQETLELIEATAGRPRATAALQGFSLAFNSGSTVEAVSLFAEAEVLFGSDT